MKKSYIYFDDKKLTCSQCGDSETAEENGFIRFKIHPVLNKNIVRTSSSNPDVKFWAECPTCNRQTGLYPSPYLYY